MLNGQLSVTELAYVNDDLDKPGIKESIAEGRRMAEKLIDADIEATVYIGSGNKRRRLLTTEDLEQLEAKLQELKAKIEGLK